MFTLKQAAGHLAASLAVVALVPHDVSAQSQTIANTCTPPQVIPLTGTEPAAKLVVEAPLAEPLASRAVVVIPYCAQNMRIVPVFGPGALSASPRVGHIHVTVDEAAWRWADASGTPIILQGLSAGQHAVRIDLVNANHQVVDSSTVKFEVPSLAEAHQPS